jgi:hypothetical protein
MRKLCSEQILKQNGWAQHKRLCEKMGCNELGIELNELNCPHYDMMYPTGDCMKSMKWKAQRTSGEDREYRTLLYKTINILNNPSSHSLVWRG